MKTPRQLRARHSEVIVLGGGIAGLSAAIYLGRSQRQTLLIDSGTSLVRWASDVENYLGFPQGISGLALLKQGRLQALRHTIRFVRTEILTGRLRRGLFLLRSRTASYSCNYLLLATGLVHKPPDINGVNACLGHSIFFCKDCDGVRVRGKRIAIYGTNDDAAEYALAMRIHSPDVVIVTDGHRAGWSRKNTRYISLRRIPVHEQKITHAVRVGCQLKKLQFQNGTDLPLDALFTTRGDIFHNHLAKMLGAKISHGEILINRQMRTSVPGLYAAGCVTPANCQAIIAAGQGATAAQAINRQIFEASLQRKET